MTRFVKSIHHTPPYPEEEGLVMRQSVNKGCLETSTLKRVSHFEKVSQCDQDSLCGKVVLYSRNKMPKKAKKAKGGKGKKGGYVLLP